MKRILASVALILIVSACIPILQEPASQDYSPSATNTPFDPDTPTPTQTLTPTSTVTPTDAPLSGFSFVITTDISYTGGKEYIDYPNFFAALLGYVKEVEAGVFMVSPGDLLPIEETRLTISQVMGEDYLWFPLPGNHDFDNLADIRYLQNYDYDPNGEAEPNIVNRGPDSCPYTTYSFDYQNAHFVALNVYCNEESPWGIDGSITDTIYDWLADDLAATDKEHIFIFGHEPAYPQPDEQTGILEHDYESLDEYPEARDRFWQLLVESGVAAYIHGHTHTYSAMRFDGVWQIGAGQAMGVRAMPSPGTFLIISVQGEEVNMQTYRGEEGPGFAYLLYEELQLKP
jgi:hypothetical protein